MAVDLETQLHMLVETIKKQRATVDAEARRLRSPAIIASFDKRDPQSWCLAVMGDSLVRVRLLLEQNFHYIETMGVIAVSRYLFELSVWLNLFERDERYGLVYYGQLLETQQKYYSAYQTQLQREVEMLRKFEKKEQEGQRAVIEEDDEQIDQTALVSRLKSVGQMIDAEAARKFSIYANQAKWNGYGFQAHLVEKKAMPSVKEARDSLSTEQAEFDLNVLPLIKDLVLQDGKKRHWKWNKMAEIVDLLAEYEFIYAFTSKLLHATPVSITTDQKNLELDEMLMFLRYIDVKISDMLDLARRYPRDSI